MAKDLVNELYKFINSDKSVSYESLREATDAAYAGVGKENDDILKEHVSLMKQTQLFTRMPEQLLTITAETILAEWAVISKNTVFLKEHVKEAIPEGWDGVVSAMKGVKEISNPNALAWYMNDKGYKTYKAEEGKLTANLANIQDPAKEIASLAEEKKDSDKKVPPHQVGRSLDIKNADAGITEEPEKGRLQKELDKETPDVDKKSDFQVAAKVSKSAKVEPEVTGVRVSKDKELRDSDNAAMAEGRLVKDPSTVKDPMGQVQSLAEERALVTVSDKLVADDIAKKYQGGRVVNDDAKKQFVVMVQQEAVLKEETTSTPTESEIRAGDVPEVKAAPEEKVSKLTPVSGSDPKDKSIQGALANTKKNHEDGVVGDEGNAHGKQSAPTGDPSAATGKADQNASKARHDATQHVLQHTSDPKGQTTTAQARPEVQDVNTVAGTKAIKADKLTPESTVKEEVEIIVKSSDAGATVSVTPTATATTEITPEVAPEEVEPEITPAEQADADMEFSEEEAGEFAERVFVSDYLTSLGEGKLSAKQKAFIAETKAKKMSKKSKEKVEKKLKALKDKKNKK